MKTKRSILSASFLAFAVVACSITAPARAADSGQLQKQKTKPAAEKQTSAQSIEDLHREQSQRFIGTHMITGAAMPFEHSMAIIFTDDKPAAKIYVPMSLAGAVKQVEMTWVAGKGLHVQPKDASGNNIPDSAYYGVNMKALEPGSTADLYPRGIAVSGSGGAKSVN